jgi:hypothetical protein
MVRAIVVSAAVVAVVGPIAAVYMSLPAVE